MSDKSWTERPFGGFRKTSERLSENLTAVVGTAKLDNATLDEVEDALIMSDLGPSAARRIRDKLAEKRFGLAMTEHELKEAVAEEIAEILRPVAKPLAITAFPRPQVILVIGVNGQRQDHHDRQARASVSGRRLRRDAGGGRHVPRSGDRPAQGLGRTDRRADRNRS